MPDFTVNSAIDPSTKATVWYATPNTGEKGFVVGNSVKYSDGDGPHVGIGQGKTLSKVPRLYFDRDIAGQEPGVGLWSHFMWPTVSAESYGGHHLIVNSYDRARFTFGFYQLAAHTPNDNLILLFRALLALPAAQSYFPDLRLVGGKVHFLQEGNTRSLETVTLVHRPNGKKEDQIVGFMTYLNPDTLDAGAVEAKNAARLMHWMLNDPEALRASEATAVSIMRRKVKDLAMRLGLSRHRVEMAIWASDIRHQNRGSEAQIAAALARPDQSARFEALYQIGSSNPDYDSRRDTVRSLIEKLMAENRFEGVTLGDSNLPWS